MLRRHWSVSAASGAWNPLRVTLNNKVMGRRGRYMCLLFARHYRLLDSNTSGCPRGVDPPSVCVRTRVCAQNTDKCLFDSVPHCLSTYVYVCYRRSLNAKTFLFPRLLQYVLYRKRNFAMRYNSASHSTILQLTLLNIKSYTFSLWYLHKHDTCRKAA
jgi:hypothetical protein